MLESLWVIPLFGLAVLGIWVVACQLLSRLGWRQLARRYPNRSDAPGPHWLLPWGRVGLANYRSTLKLTATHEGLRVTVIAPMRPGHDPILLPWQDIAVEHTHWVTVPAVRLSMTRHPGIGIVIPAKHAHALAQTVGESWPEASADASTRECRPPT